MVLIKKCSLLRHTLALITGKSAGFPVGRAETDSRSGVKADPVIKSTFPGSATLCLSRLHGRQGASLSRFFDELYHVLGHIDLVSKQSGPLFSPPLFEIVDA